METYKMKTFELISGKECDIIEAHIIGYEPKYNLPIVDLPMMSDERWNEMCYESTMRHYRELSGMGEAPDYETAKKWEREYFHLDEDDLEQRKKPIPILGYFKNEESPL